MKPFFTLTGTNYRYGSDFMKNGMKVKLTKEPENDYDKKAKGKIMLVTDKGVICRLVEE